MRLLLRVVLQAGVFVVGAILPLLPVHQWYTFAAVGAVLLLSYYGGAAAARRLLSGPGRAPAPQPRSSG